MVSLYGLAGLGFRVLITYVGIPRLVDGLLIAPKL